MTNAVSLSTGRRSDDVAQVAERRRQDAIGVGFVRRHGEARRIDRRQIVDGAQALDLDQHRRRRLGVGARRQAVVRQQPAEDGELGQLTRVLGETRQDRREDAGVGDAAAIERRRRDRHVDVDLAQERRGGGARRSP